MASTLPSTPRSVGSSCLPETPTRPSRLPETPTRPPQHQRTRPFRAAHCLDDLADVDLDAQQAKAARYSAILARFVSQLDSFQAWLQSSAEGRAISPQDARAKVEALEAVETALCTLHSTVKCAGGGAPNRAAQLLRQADREQALQGVVDNENQATSPQVLLLLHNLASSSARTSALVVQALRSATPAMLSRLDGQVEELVLQAKQDLIAAAGWGPTRPQAQTEATGRTRSRLQVCTGPLDPARPIALEHPPTRHVPRADIPRPHPCELAQMPPSQSVEEVAGIGQAAAADYSGRSSTPTGLGAGPQGERSSRDASHHASVGASDVPRPLSHVRQHSEDSRPPPPCPGSKHRASSFAPSLHASDPSCTSRPLAGALAPPTQQLDPASQQPLMQPPGQPAPPKAPLLSMTPLPMAPLPRRRAASFETPSPPFPTQTMPTPGSLLRADGTGRTGHVAPVVVGVDRPLLRQQPAPLALSPESPGPLQRRLSFSRREIHHTSAQ